MYCSRVTREEWSTNVNVRNKVLSWQITQVQVGTRSNKKHAHKVSLMAWLVLQAQEKNVRDVYTYRVIYILAL